jgi:hypothetical protein
LNESFWQGAEKENFRQALCSLKSKKDERKMASEREQSRRSNTKPLNSSEKATNRGLLWRQEANFFNLKITWWQPRAHRFASLILRFATIEAENYTMKHKCLIFWLEHTLISLSRHQHGTRWVSLLEAQLIRSMCLRRLRAVDEKNYFAVLAMKWELKKREKATALS